MTLAVLLAVLTDLEDGRALPGYPRAVAVAILEAVEHDREPPVFGSRDADAAVLGLWAWRESRLDPYAVNPAGRSFGAWQQGRPCGTAPVTQQARCFLHLLHAGARLCPDSPGAVAWGACHARDVLTGRDVAELAAERVERALRALARVREPLPPLPREPGPSADPRGGPEGHV